MDFGIIAVLFLGVVWARTWCWSFNTWQLREYRWDRMWDHQTNPSEGWTWVAPIFRGILPRPRLSARVILMGLLWGGIFGLLGLVAWAQFDFRFGWELAGIVLLWERTTWWQVGVVAWLSHWILWPARQRLFSQARQIREQSTPELVVIGITGSYGKTSTKELLLHLLRQGLSPKQVIATPKNENNEIAIARWIKRHQDFFVTTKGPRVAIIEMGAYSQGEIAKIAAVAGPDISLITAVSNQHLALFGSIDRLAAAKFELAQATSSCVFYNAESPRLAQEFREKKSNLVAKQKAISSQAATKVLAKNNLHFTWENQSFTLPWNGEFWLINALMALEVAKHLGIPEPKLALALANAPSPDKALWAQPTSSGATIWWDIHSANTTGTLAAISELQKSSGRKIFIGLPLRELGAQTKSDHHKIFTALKNIQAEVYWCRSDLAKFGQTILGQNWKGEPTPEGLKKIATELQKNDGVLLESRLPKWVETVFRENI